MGEPCVTEPDGATTKLVGFIEGCRDCGSVDCWLHYLRWEVACGIDLNEASHWIVKLPWVDTVPSDPRQKYIRASAIRDNPDVCGFMELVGYVIVNDLVRS